MVSSTEMLVQCSEAVKMRNQALVPVRKGTENKTLCPVKACTFIIKLCNCGSFIIKAVTAEKVQSRGIQMTKALNWLPHKETRLASWDSSAWEEQQRSRKGYRGLKIK